MLTALRRVAVVAAQFSDACLKVITSDDVTAGLEVSQVELQRGFLRRQGAPSNP